MKTDKPTQRLAIYKKALKDWEKALEPRTSHTSSGFCYYFKSKGLDVYRPDNFMKNLPELYKQRTSPGLSHYTRSGLYLEGRIERQKALKRAIKLTEKIIEDAIK